MKFILAHWIKLSAVIGAAVLVFTLATWPHWHYLQALALLNLAVIFFHFFEEFEFFESVEGLVFFHEFGCVEEASGGGGFFSAGDDVGHGSFFGDQDCVEDIFDFAG